MLRHALAPLILVALLVAISTYQGALKWSGTQVTAALQWQQTGGGMGVDVTTHRIWMQIPSFLFAGLLVVTVVVLTAFSYFLFRRRAGTNHPETK